MKETPFKEKVEKLINAYNAWYIKYWAGAKYTKEGIPDILACINGLFFGIELKGDGGRPKLLQLVKLRKIREAKGIGVLLYPKDLSDFEALIRGHFEGQQWYEKNIKEQDEWFKKLSS